MNLRFFSVVAAGVWCVGIWVSADDAGRRARGPIVYDSHWQVHHVDPGIRVHGDDADDRSSVRAPTSFSRGTGFDEMRLPQTVSPGYMPPPQMARPDQEERERRRNWIIPTLDDDGPVYDRRRSEDEEPSGWGWLADEVDQRRRERDVELEERDAQQEEAESEWFMQRDPVRTGLFTSDSFDPIPLRAAPGETENEAERDRERVRRSRTNADLASNERSANATDSRALEDDPYEAADPYESDPLGASPWELDMLQQDNGFAISRFSSSSPESWNREPAIGSASTAPMFSSWRESLAPASSEPVRIQNSSSTRRDFQEIAPVRTDSADMLGASFGGDTDRTEFGMGNMGDTGFTPTSDFGERWGADWSGDSGWQGGITEPARASEITPISPSSAGSLHNHGWLADPGR